MFFLCKGSYQFYSTKFSYVNTHAGIGEIGNSVEMGSGSSLTAPRLPVYTVFAGTSVPMFKISTAAHRDLISGIMTDPKIGQFAFLSALDFWTQK